jgi:hypothetical protein
MKTVDRKGLATALKLSVSHFDVLRRDGVLKSVNPGERRPLFNLEEAVTDYTSHRKLVKKRLDGTEKFNASILKRWKSRVRLASQKLAKLQSKTIYLRDVQEAWDTIRAVSTKRLTQFPAAIAGELVNLKDVPEIAERLDNAVRELLWSMVEDLGGARPSGEDNVR